MKRLLVIDDEAGHRLMVRAVMEDAGWGVSEAGSGEDGLAVLDREHVDVVLLDMRMPGMDGAETLQRILSREARLPVVMLTAYSSVSTAVDAMKHGAYDYLAKPADNEELLAVLEKAYEYGQLVRENADLKSRLSQETSGRRIIGESPAMRRVLELVAQAGPAEATVLIRGESGTGKELVAEALHAAGERADKPLVKVNCAALPETLLESELFGYVRGAFTGAVKDKPGRFQLAESGSLFLDEIGEMPAPLQAKLLRALQEHVVEPLGSIKPLAVDVRIIAATNLDLQAEVKAGRFREDLFYRLNVLEIVVPPLRERLSDLPLLVGFLLDKLAVRNRKEPPKITPAFLEALTCHHWPGNVRELENVLERAIILSRSLELGLETLPPHVLGNGAAAISEPCPEGNGTGAMGPMSLEDAEKQALIRVLAAHGGHREKTAQALGVSRRTLQYKLSKYGLTKR